MQAAQIADEFMARAQVEMVGIREDDLGPELFERFLGQGFDRSLGAHGHEERGLDRAVRSGEAAAARASGIGLRYFE